MTAPEAILTVGVWQDSGVLGDVAANMATIRARPLRLRVAVYTSLSFRSVS